MRLTVTILGVTVLDVAVTTDTSGADVGVDLSGGTTESTPVGFTPPPDRLREDPGRTYDRS